MSRKRHQNRDEGREPRQCECGQHAFVFLTQGMVALLDVEDAPRISGRKWSAIRRRGGYHAVRHEKKKKAMIYMARFIMNAPAERIVDHINHDGLDNRRKNLRVCSHAENMRNRRTSRKYKGTYYIKSRNKWMAAVAVNGKRKTIGYFASEQEAAAAYDEAALRLHGPFAMTNAKLQARKERLCVPSKRGRSAGQPKSSCGSALDLSGSRDKQRAA